MDEITLAKLINNCVHLKYKFDGVYAANNFRPLQKDSFQIVNTSPAHHTGTHWVVIARKKGKMIFADPLGNSIQSYILIFTRCSRFYTNICNFSYPIQPTYSNDCGIYCIFIAHVIFSNKFPAKLYIGSYGLRQFITHML